MGLEINRIPLGKRSIDCPLNTAIASCGVFLCYRSTFSAVTMSAISFAINGVGWYHISMRNVEKFLKFVLLVLVVARIFAQNPDLKQEITSQVGESINQISNLSTNQIVSSVVDNLGDIPEYSGNATVELNNNQPFFLNDECMYATTISYEYYAPLDNLGRCTYS